MNQSVPSLPAIFREAAEPVISGASPGSAGFELSEKNGKTKLFIPKTNPDGFDVTVIADNEEISVYTEFLAHRHFTSDGNHREVCALALGLVRDLLASNMRVHVFEVGGSPYRAILEAHHNGQWVHDGETRLFVFSWFRKKTERFYSNQRLPVRNLFGDPSGS